MDSLLQDSIAMNDEIQKALLKKAGSLLARRAHSRGELQLKLAKMAEDSDVECALNRLEQLNLLNDADYAYNFAFYRIRQEGWSFAKVRDALFRHHLSQAIIESALERARNELGDEFALIECIKKRYGKQPPPASPKDIQKFILFLRRRGFDDDAIFRGLRRMLPAAAIQGFETGE
jgi:SOS response regulatory protein OraA/RecX